MATQEDLEKVDQAIIDLAAGDRIEQVDFSDGHSVKYARTSLGDLERVRTGVQRKLSPRRPVRILSSKGL